MEIGKNYEAAASENKWYRHWMEKGYFFSQPDERKPYTIVMPPPNVTGVLHMGHALNNTVQDILIRRAKMQGYNTCWVPGTDHASIATEAKVVAMLREKGIDKNSLSREAFLEYAWEWKEKYGGIILEQLKKLGCALDWNRTSFTMDEHYYQAVIRVFVELYNKGYIYKGKRMINWDPEALTALSDEEVIHKETQSKLTYIRYQIEGTKDYITIATVRPETILGDTAICVHPEDPRYAHLRGEFCLVPLINRRIPVIFDTYIDREFGTGALKVTPAHDINDYNLGLKHRLETLDILDEDGRLNEAAGLFVGEDRFVVRKKIVESLKAAGNFVKEEDYTNQVGYSERTNAVVEPRLSEQWWCKMDTMAEPALKAVMEEAIAFFPSKFKNLYRHWMENIKEWGISRQLWWGHRIPAWYDAQGNMYVAATVEEAAAQFVKQFPEGDPATLKQDEDVLDTWFSSWLWPLEVFNWNASEQNEELSYYYPTQTLVTAPEIIFFWVARMIMAGYEFKQEKPFEQVYFTGIVRDKQGRKMSKSLGNSPDLLKLIDDYGADAVRFGVMIASPAGNDILFDEASLEQGRHFINKIWNALKLVKLWEDRQDAAGEQPLSEADRFAMQWLSERIESTRQQVAQQFGQFKLSEALKTIYSLVWDDFCSWYLEWIKPAREATIHPEVYQHTLQKFTELLQLLHPYMPFVTEEMHHLLQGAEAEDLMVRLLPEEKPVDATLLERGGLLQQLISAVRDARNKSQLKPKDTVSLFVETAQTDFYALAGELLKKQVNAGEIVINATAPAGCMSAMVGREKLFIQSHEVVDVAVQRAKLEQEVKYLKGFLVSIEKKLGNERFIQNAKPEVIENERKKQADALAKIESLEGSLSGL